MSRLRYIVSRQQGMTDSARSQSYRDHHRLLPSHLPKAVHSYNAYKIRRHALLCARIHNTSWHTEAQYRRVDQCSTATNEARHIHQQLCYALPEFPHVIRSFGTEDFLSDASPFAHVVDYLAGKSSSGNLPRGPLKQPAGPGM